MCLPLVAQVVAIDGEMAEIELRGSGERARAGTALYPDVVAGQHVLVDRGLIIELIDAAQSDELFGFYQEFAQFMDAEEAAVG